MTIQFGLLDGFKKIGQIGEKIGGEFTKPMMPKKFSLATHPTKEPGTNGPDPLLPEEPPKTFR